VDTGIQHEDGHIQGAYVIAALLAHANTRYRALYITGNRGRPGRRAVTLHVLNALRTIRENSGLCQIEIGEKAGYDRSTFSGDYALHKTMDKG
jgi:hypothetical protein